MGKEKNYVGCRAIKCDAMFDFGEKSCSFPSLSPYDRPPISSSSLYSTVVYVGERNRGSVREGPGHTAIITTFPLEFKRSRGGGWCARKTHRRTGASTSSAILKQPQPAQRIGECFPSNKTKLNSSLIAALPPKPKLCEACFLRAHARNSFLRIRLNRVISVFEREFS